MESKHNNVLWALVIFSKIAGSMIMVVLLIMAAGTAPCAAAGGSYMFKFDPPDWTTYVHELTKVKVTDMGEAGSHKDVGKVEALVFIRRTETGYAIRYTVLEMSMERDGKEVSNPVFDLLSGIEVWLHLNADGELLSIEGYDEVYDIIQNEFPPEVARQLSKMINVEDLKNKEKAEWDGRIGGFIGTEFRIGDALLNTDEYALPDGKKIMYYSGHEFKQMTECDGNECVQIEFRYNTDAGDLASFFNRKQEEFQALPSQIPESSGIAIQGQGSRMIDPDTMLIYSETISRDIDMNMRDSGTNPATIHIKETQEHSFDYSRGRFWFLSTVSDPVFIRLEELGFEGLAEQDRIFIAVWVLEGQVNNGGFEQFYFNNSGEMAQDAAAAFEEIGAHGRADIIRRANSVFPDGKPPRDDAARNALFESLSEEKFELLSTLDDEYFTIDEDVDQLLFDYVRKHQNHFMQ